MNFMIHLLFPGVSEPVKGSMLGSVQVIVRKRGGSPFTSWCTCHAARDGNGLQATLVVSPSDQRWGHLHTHNPKDSRRGVHCQITTTQQKAGRDEGRRQEGRDACGEAAGGVTEV